MSPPPPQPGPRWLIVGFALLIGIASRCVAQDFTILERCTPAVSYDVLQPYYISANGRIVLAADNGNFSGQAYRFIRTDFGWECLRILASGDNDVLRACSPDGSQIIGEAAHGYDAYHCRMFRWNQGVNTCLDPTLSPGPYLYYFAASSEDTAAYAFARYPRDTPGARSDLLYFSRTGAPYEMPIEGASPVRLSRDGSIGYAFGRALDGADRLFTWRDGDPAQTMTLPANVLRMKPIRVMPDGESLLASGEEASTRQPWVWSPMGGWTALTQLRGFTVTSSSGDLTAMIIGTDRFWSPETGVVNVNVLIENAGFPLGSYSSFTTVAISDDGNSITGYLKLPPLNGARRPWVFRRTTPCDADYNGDGNRDQDDVAYLINTIAGGPNPNNRSRDFNQDGNVDQDDVMALIQTISSSVCP